MASPSSSPSAAPKLPSKEEYERAVWNVIDAHFSEHPQSLVRHHIESYDDFTSTGVAQLLRETNPIKVDLEYNHASNNFGASARLFFGGKDGDKVFFGKPIIYDTPDNTHFMFPNEARLRNMTYSMPIYCDVEIEIEQKVDVSSDVSTDGSTDVAAADGATSLDQGVKPVDVDENGLKVSRDPAAKHTDREIANIRKTLHLRPDGSTVQRFTLAPIRRFLCNLPIMVQSSSCILRGLDREARFALGECRNDVGGYFIIAGKEKTVVCQEIFGDNMLYVQKVDKPDAPYAVTAKIRSVSENVSKPVRTLAVHLANPGSKYSNGNILVDVPNVRKPVPLFILFRALGVISDRSIISTCLLRDAAGADAATLNWFLPSVHDASCIQSQNDALQYMALLVKGKTVNRVLYVLADLFLPHVGEVNFRDKAFYLGHIVGEMLAVDSGVRAATDRDNFKYKRIEPVGTLLRSLFREYFLLYTANVRRGFETKYEFNKAAYADMSVLIETTQEDVFADYGKNQVDVGIKKAFKGSWGATPETRRVGVVQDMNRLSFLGYISHMRKTNLALDASVKLVGPRVLHGSQWGIIDPIDTPDGGNIGIHKHLAILTYLTRAHSREPILRWMRSKPAEIGLVDLAALTPARAGEMVKVMVNGFWAGSIADPLRAAAYMRACRRWGLLPASTSIAFDIPSKTIVVLNDGGRLCWPVFFRSDAGDFPFYGAVGSSPLGKLWAELQRGEEGQRSGSGGAEVKWTDLLVGRQERRVTRYDPMQSAIYEWGELYGDGVAVGKQERPAIVEYLDTNEAEYANIALNTDALRASIDAAGGNAAGVRQTHHEIHESVGYGVMCNLINYLEHNPVVRNSFSCGQSKQACSVYHTNYQMRMDKTAVVLHNGQAPLVRPRYMRHINREENPNGVNAIVAIMCYTGYNVEDAILVNEGALRRGLFRTTYYSTYEAHEEKTTRGDSTYIKTFANIDRLIAEGAVTGTKPEYDYSQLDADGLIAENTPVNERTVLIGMASGNLVNAASAASAASAQPTDGAQMRPQPVQFSAEPRRDQSKAAKKGQMGTVDWAFMTEGEEGQRIAKVRLREDRIPAVGDKMASRAGQKGTIGRVIREEDMPFSAEGIRPDLVVNPHALPSRMTIGHIVESLGGNAAALLGTAIDCTAYANLGKNMIETVGGLMRKLGYHSSGDEILYNGFSGEQIKVSLYFGPTYYMRLKHMVKDKINYRARGPNANLTRQPVGGRANDGGLRIGEMERDGILAHGIAEFLTDSMMERGDKYCMAVCNTTGTIAVYNPAERLMYSLAADGPVRYTGTIRAGDGDGAGAGSTGAASMGDGTSPVQLQQITRFGRSFSLVEVPYSFKLLIQELQAIGVQVRLITEDNVTHFEDLVNSRNIEAAAQVDGFDASAIADVVRRRLAKKNQQATRDAAPPPTRQRPPSPEGPPPPVMGGGEDGGGEDAGAEETGLTEPDYSHLTVAANKEVRHGGGSGLGLGLEPEPGPDAPSPEVVVGSGVHWRGDEVPQRLWTVTRMLPNRHVVIDTNDGSGLDVEETIKVVSVDDVYFPRPPLDMVYAAPTFVPATDGMVGGGGHADYMPVGSAFPPVFAPVVKIFNGGGADLSTGGGAVAAGTGTGAGTGESGGFDAAIVNAALAGSGGMGGGMGGTMPASSAPSSRAGESGTRKSTAAPPPTFQAPSGTTGGGGFDFSKPFVINKVG